MKYIITESQYRLIKEDYSKWLKRRLNRETLEKSINDAIVNNKTICDDYYDEFEYADQVINTAVDNYLLVLNIEDFGEEYDDLYNTVIDFCKEEFGQELFEQYYETCGDEND